MRPNTYLILCAVVGAAAPTMSAQVPSTDRLVFASTIGGRGFTNNPDSFAVGKFQEYQDVRARRPLLEQMFLKYLPVDSFATYQVSARKLFDRDQSLWLVAKKPGAFDFQVRWDRIPHTYSTTARSPGNEDDPGFNSLPTPRPDSTAWLRAPFIGPIRSQTDPIKLSLGLTPSENVEFKTEFIRISKTGGRPGSMTFNATTGPTREFVEPLDQTTSDFRVSQGWSSGERPDDAPAAFVKNVQLIGTYAYSRFENAVKSTMVDDPLLGVSSPTSGAATSRLSLAPSNAAQTVTVTGAASLPMRTRLTSTFTGSWQSQNEAFFPQTSNDSLRSNANFGLLALPRASLNGHARTSVVNAALNSHPLDRLTISARFRNFDYSNSTDPFHVQAMAISDRTINLADSLTSEVHPFSKENEDVSASYTFMDRFSVTGGYAWETWTRDTTVRNVAKTVERTPRVSVDYIGIDWLTLRASYSSGKRRGNGYVVGDATETIGFRPFDESDRDRRRTNVMVAVSPIQALTLSVDYETGSDRYPNSPYGTQSDKSTMTGGAVDWNAGDRFSASLGYVKESYDNYLYLRYKTGAVGSITYNNPTYNWYNQNSDKDRTTYANLHAVVIPDKLDVGGTYSLADAHFWVYNGNPVKPTGGTVAQDSAATTVNWPEVSQRLQPVTLFARYVLTTDWAVTLRYQGELYRQTDFRTMAPSYVAATGQLPSAIGVVAGSNTGQYHFLGDNYFPYNANWLTLLVSYHPAMLSFARGRSTF